MVDVQQHRLGAFEQHALARPLGGIQLAPVGPRRA